jgi:perosamine synthetase
LIPRFRPLLGGAEFAAMSRPARPGDIEQFENAFARAVGQRHAVAFPYGRTGLLALLAAMGFRGREIICPAYTCVVVPHAIVIGGNRPVFVDSQADANMDLAAAQAAIRERTAALIATSIFGNPVDLDHLARISRQHPSLAVIQDCAHSFNATWRGRPVNIEGTAAIFGLNASKIMTSIFGGAVTTDDAALAQAVRAERSRLLAPATLAKSVGRALYMIALDAAFWPPAFGLTEALRRAGLLNRFTRYYDEAVIDMPPDYAMAMTGVEARVGTVQAGRLADFIAARRRYVAFYRQELRDLDALAWIEGADGSSHSHIAARVNARDLIVARAAARGIQLGQIIDYCVPEMTAYREAEDSARFPVAHALSQQTINLPASGRFEQAQAERVVAVMREILTGQPAPPPLCEAGP